MAAAWRSGVPWVLGVLIACGCAMHSDGGGEPKQAARAKAKIGACSGSQVSGMASFVASSGEVKLALELDGLEPGVHAVHIHEKGDCSAPDGTSAGDHWNPTAAQHGAWGHGSFHLGDIGNLTVGQDGRGTLSLSTDRWTIGGGGVNDILNRSVIVHAKPDDFTTQPTGAAGGRIGCGVIQQG